MSDMSRHRATSPRADVRRTCPKLIRFSPEELARVVDRARAAKLVPARYVREAALGSTPRPRQAPVGDELVRRLARLGVILRDLSSTVHAHDAGRGAMFDAALAEVLDVIRTVG